MMGKHIIALALLASILTHTATLNLTPDKENSKGLRMEDHTRLTEDKRIALDRLMSRVLPKLKEDFMKQDLYLLRFLEAKDFDVEKAELMVLNHLQYREDNKLDKVQDEDWSDLEKDYPYRIEGMDKLGRPIIQFDYGKWNINKAANTGMRDRLTRYYNKMLDEATMRVIDLQSLGNNVTQWVWLADVNGVNMKDHLGFAESWFYYDWIQAFENNHPGMAGDTVIINAPPIFGPAFRLIISGLSEKTKQFEQYYDPNEWKPILDNLIDPDQLPPQYGGIRGTDKSPVVFGGFQRKKDGSWWWNWVW